MKKLLIVIGIIALISCSEDKLRTVTLTEKECICDPAVADTCYVIPVGHRDSPEDSLSCTPFPPGQKDR